MRARCLFRRALTAVGMLLGLLCFAVAVLFWPEAFLEDDDDFNLLGVFDDDEFVEVEDPWRDDLVRRLQSEVVIVPTTEPPNDVEATEPDGGLKGRPIDKIANMYDPSLTEEDKTRIEQHIKAAVAPVWREWKKLEEDPEVSDADVDFGLELARRRVDEITDDIYRQNVRDWPGLVAFREALWSSIGVEWTKEKEG